MGSRVSGQIAMPSPSKGGSGLSDAVNRVEHDSGLHRVLTEHEANGFLINCGRIHDVGYRYVFHTGGTYAYRHDSDISDTSIIALVDDGDDK